MLTARLVEFVKPLEDQAIPEGESATFSCELNFDDVTVTWFKKGVKLQKGRGVQIEADGSCHKITFAECNVDDMGTVSMSAENLQAGAELKIIAEDLAIVQGLEDQTVVEGDSVTLVCQLNKSNVAGK